MLLRRIIPFSHIRHLGKKREHLNNYQKDKKNQEWQNRVVNGPKYTGQWNGKNMARPVNRRTAKRRLRFPFQLNLATILGIAFVLFACATVITLATAITQNMRKDVKAESIVEEKAPVAIDEMDPQFEGQMRILLLGSDQRPNEGGFRTDAILMVVLDSEEKTVSVVSFPRDLWVQVPSLYEMKINQVYELGGFEAMAGMFDANFGLRPDYFMMTNFTGFMQFIDNRGGIDVGVGQELTDDCDLPQQVDGDCTVTPGMIHMDGPTALWYVRSRNTSSDLDRLRREQEVVLALVKKVVSFQTIQQFSEIKDELNENIETNLSIEQGVKLIPFATTILNHSDRIRKVAISEEQATPSWSWNGMWILLPDTNAIRSLMEEAGIHLR